jgi:hypothetical protein
MLEIPRTSIHRILWCGLKKHPYHIQVFHNLQEEDYPCRAAMCAELIDQTESANLTNKVLLSDKEPSTHVETSVDITVAFGRTRNHLLFLNGNETHQKWIYGLVWFSQRCMDLSS